MEQASEVLSTGSAERNSRMTQLYNQYAILARGRYMQHHQFRACAVGASVLLATALLSVPGTANGGSAGWTFALYICSDNDLDYWAEVNLEQLMSVGSTRKVNFVVLWDPSTGPADLFYVDKGELVMKSDFAYSGMETNMGDPKVLAAFADYLNAKYKAENVMMDLWDHGDDFRGICFDDNPGTGEDRDFLTHQEIVAALDGKGMDIVAADGCGIGTVEVAYEYALGGIAEWLVANENYVPLQGFPYDVIASDLVRDPGMDAEELSAIIVEHYAEYYQGGWLTELAAIHLPSVPGMVQELWDVTAILMDDMGLYKGLVASGKAKATMGWSQYGWEGFVDFPTIFEVVLSRAPVGSDLAEQTEELLDAIWEAVPYVGAGTPADVWDPEGLSVFFPGSNGSFTHNTWWRGSLYPTMQFAQDGWLEFLQTYYAV